MLEVSTLSLVIYLSMAALMGFAFGYLIKTHVLNHKRDEDFFDYLQRRDSLKQINTYENMVHGKGKVYQDA